MRICVFGAASPTISNDYKEKVITLGKTLVQRGHSLVFGGGGNGLMGAVADGVHQKGGYVFGVIPKFFEVEKVEALCENCDKLVQPDTMRQRKQIMEDNSDAFIVTPGGIGTFEEFFEILTLKQLCRHNKPIAIYNINGYYNEILYAIEKAMEKNFIRDDCKALYCVTEDINELFEYVESTHHKNFTIEQLKDG